MFGKRFNIFSVAGIKIGIDISWFFIAILLSWTLASGYFPANYPHLAKHTYWIMGVAGMLGLFVCIALHELGHASVARYYKLPISQITLFIFGGVAEIQKEPSSAKVEFLVAIAGPIVSSILAIIAYALAMIGIQLHLSVTIYGVMAYLAMMNMILVIFNLIPAFPLDGGRMFRALLWWWKKNLAWATRVATAIGSGFGFSLIFLGIFNLILGNFLAAVWLMILGWFLHKAASSMHIQFYVGKELKGEKVSKFMKIDFISVPPNISIKDFVVQYIYVSHHNLYPVVEQGKLLGYISLNEVKSVAHADWEKKPVSEVMENPQTQTVSLQASALEALEMLQNTPHSMLFIVDNQRLVGILTAQDLFKIISLKLELENV